LGGQPEDEQRGKESPEIDESPDAQSGDELLQGLFRHVADIASHASRLTQLRVARWQVRASWAVSAAILGLILLLVTTATGLAGVWLVFRGLPATLTELTGVGPGVADLVSGLALLAGIAVFVLAARSWGERRILRELEERDEAEESSD